MQTELIEQSVAKWKELTNSITELWIKKYFELSDEDCEEGVDFYWIANDVGTVFEFADYYFDFGNVLDCYKYNITKEQLFSWYEYCLENQKINISLAKFILSPQEKLEKEQKELADSKERLEYANNEFQKCLNKYGKEEDFE